MFRQHNFLQTGKYPKISHAFSSRKHLIFRSYEKGTVITYLTKRVKIKGEAMMDYYQLHIYNNILPYLARVNGAASSLLRVRPQLGEIMIQGQYEEQSSDDFNSDEQQKEGTDNRTEVDGSTLFISKQMIEGKSLKQMVIHKDTHLNDDFCLDLVGNIVDFILGGGGVRDLLITSENIIVEDSGLLHLNYFSLIGIDFFKLNRYISREEFEEMLPYLTSQFMMTEKHKHKISILMQIKFIMINFYSAFFKRDLAFDPKNLDIEIEVKKNDDKVLAVVKRVQNKLMPDLLSERQQTELQKLDKKHHVNYLALLTLAMKPPSQQNKEYYLNWQYILQKLSKRVYTVKDSEVEVMKEFRVYEIKNNEDQFAENITELIDLYTSLTNLVVQEIQAQGLGNTNMKKSSFDKLRATASELSKQRQSMLEDERYSRSLFIPLKTSMPFAQILHYNNWVHMLLTATDVSSKVLQALSALLGFIVEITEIMVAIEPFISKEMLRDAVFEKRRFKSTSNFRRFYGFLEFIIEDNRVDLDADVKDGPDCLENKWKGEFWNGFFGLLNGLTMLTKRCFLETTEYQLATIKVNRHEFAEIAKRIQDSTPPLSSSLESEGSSSISSQQWQGSIVSDEG